MHKGGESMTLREAFDRCLPNERGERDAKGKSREGGRFTVVEKVDGTIFFWQVSHPDETERLLQEEPQGVQWWPGRVG